MDERTQFILNCCRGKRVLHIGCADWPYTERRIKDKELLHTAIMDVASEVVGIDVSVEGLDFLREALPGKRFILPEEAADIHFAAEVIVAGEVIEHVENPGEFIGFISSLSVDETVLLLTTPNAYSIKGAMRAMVGREYCHPDHLVHFSSLTLSHLLEKYGWKSEVIRFYFSRPTTFIGKAASIVFSILRALMSPRIGDGIMLTARRRSSST